MSLLLALFACSYDPTVGTLPDNVGQAFAPCQESEIKFLATKHNFSLAFEPCGKNSFGAFAWAPSGIWLYFQLGQTGYVMNAEAENKQTLTVPTPSPIGEAAWLTPAQLALPVGPAEEGGKNRLAVFDIEQQSVYYRDVSAAFIDKVVRSPTAGEALVVTADTEDGPRSVQRLVLADGAASRAYPWASGADTFDLVVTDGLDMDSPVPGVVAVLGRGQTVTLHDAANGEVWKTFEGATAGSLHRRGRWLALEREGEEVSVFYQRAWDDMTEAQRRREQKRAEKLAAGLPDSYPKTVRPPSFDIVDLRDDARWNLTSVHGTDFSWYEAQDYWASFIFWGFEGKQFKRNVLLGQMGDRLRATELGRDFMGVEAANSAAESRVKPAQKASPKGE